MAESELRRITLGPAHKPTGTTRHYIGKKLLPPPASLKVVRWEGDPGYYLLYCDAAGAELTDTYHASLEGALRQAQFEFGIEPHEWETPGGSAS